MEKDVKFISIQESEAQSITSVWVMNYSDPKGNLHFSAADGMGGQVIVKIPVTWIPIDLTTQLTKNNILNNPIFRRFVMQGLVRIVSNESAMKIMESKNAQEEARRVYSLNDAPVSQSMTLPEGAKSVQTDNVSGFAMNLANLTDADENQVLNTLEGQESALTKADFAYIAQNSIYLKVKEFASKRAVSM